MKKKYWYPTAFSVWGDEEKAAIERVCASGQFTMGEECRAFERAFADYHGSDYAVMVNSGSSANLLMIAALCEVGKLRRGDVVYVPAIAWATTYAPLVQHGLQLRLLDCDETWNANTIKQPNVTPGWVVPPALVVGCSILGNPADLDTIRHECREWNVCFIEDNCESFGARVSDDGPLCGTYGDMASFSFFYSHQISGIEGGMVLCDDPDLVEALVKLRAHGWRRDLETAECFAQEYSFDCFGYNVRPLEMHAAVAHEQLKKEAKHYKLRRHNVAIFRALVQDISAITPQKLVGDYNPFGLSFCVPIHRREQIAQALRARGIDCRLPTGGSFTKHAYGADYRAQQTPYADFVHDRGMFLGNGPLDLEEQITTAVSVMREVLR